MKKNKFLNIIITLIIGGFITKLLGMIIKIITTRIIKEEGMGIYMMIMPTFNLLVCIAQLGFPTTISKLVAEDKFDNKKLVFSIFPIVCIINLLLMFFLIIFGHYLSYNLLGDKRTYLGIISIGFILPFITVSSILRGFFFGKERMLPHVITNIIEDVLRLILIALFLPYFMKKGLAISVAFLFLISIVSETSSILIFLSCLPKKIKISKKDFKPRKDYIKSVLDLSLPTTGSRLIGSIGYFFEPIILNFVLLKCGYSNNFIVTEYGILNGYVMPLLLLPSFFTMAISQALIPFISKAYSNNNIAFTKRKIKQAIFYSLLIGIPATLCFILFPEYILKFIYNTNKGITYIKFLAPICLLYYIQVPLTSSLQAMGKAKEAMYGTIIGVFVRTISLFIFSMFKIGIWGLIIAVSLNIIVVTINQIKYIKRFTKK